MNHNVAIRFTDVGFSHREAVVLEHASFHVHAGEFVTLVGPNGAGKTTILRLIMGLANPAYGSIEVFGAIPRSVIMEIGYVPQYMNYDQAFPISVEEVIRMGMLRGAGRDNMKVPVSEIEAALGKVGIADLVNRPYAALSGGQRRRVLVARALAGNPRLLILDEPTANMDKGSEQMLFSVLGELKGKATIMMATHDTGFVSALSDVVLCVGEREGEEHGIVRHASIPADHVSPNAHAEPLIRVLHDTELPDNACCCDDGFSGKAPAADAGAAGSAKGGQQ
ncbi:MAG: ATP-binding cassette domain-containing protein [Spirochaetaceae bacterium]|nr:ATP-binding cassette domain-containing protein [Spirochaetaceae bacterium]